MRDNKDFLKMVDDIFEDLKPRDMKKALVIYSIKDNQKEGDYDTLKELLGVDAVIQLKPDNVIEGMQYPHFQIVEL